MNKKLCVKLIFASVLFPLTSLAQQIEPSLCPDRLEGYDNIQIQQSLSQDGTRCYWGVHPRNAFETMVYRDYMISQDGFMMVFNSYGDADNSSSSGAREFFMLPSEFKGFQWSVEGSSLVLTGFAGRTLKFNLKTADLESMGGASVKVASKVSPNNKGGVEITSIDSIFVDAGFRLGNSPSYYKNSASTVKNTQSQSCQIKNSRLYNYLDGSAYLKSATELKTIVKSTCGGFIIR